MTSHFNETEKRTVYTVYADIMIVHKHVFEFKGD